MLVRHNNQSPSKLLLLRTPRLVSSPFVTSYYTKFYSPHSTTFRLKMSKRAAEDSSLDSKRPRTEGSSGALHVPAGFNISRARLLTQPTSQALHGDCVVYWMSRDQRARDNYALLYAQSVARSHNVPLRVVFNLVPRFLEATLRQYGFMIKGLKEVEDTLREHNIPFHLLMGDPVTNIPQFLNDRNALMLVTDFSPLRVGAGWVNSVAEKLNNQTHKLPLIQVDAHNIVPCWVASPKLEYSARTFRGKITPKIPEFLQEFPALVHNPAGSLDSDPVKWDEALESLQINRDVGEVDWIRPGAAAASEMLEKFIQQKLKDYGDKRNDPNNDFVSNMSPYTHFGQISVQRIILTLKAAKKSGSSVDSFIEESVVRRELTDNFCFYNPHYDSLEGCYDWAKETLNIHRNDPRPFIYTRDQLERAETHDDLWNAAQIQMTKEGKMQGFLRMYWAKKILEWTRSPEEALAFAIYLNDKFELDGRDPNGYVGCMWSIGGIHDQGWGERAIFGKIRYMNYEGCKRKFDVKKFVAKYPPASRNAAAATGQRTIAY